MTVAAERDVNGVGKLVMYKTNALLQNSASTALDRMPQTYLHAQHGPNELMECSDG